MSGKIYYCDACTDFLSLIIYYHMIYKKSIDFFKKTTFFCNFLQMHIFRTRILPNLNKFHP